MNRTPSRRLWNILGALALVAGLSMPSRAANFIFTGGFGAPNGAVIASDNDQHELAFRVLIDSVTGGGPYVYTLWFSTGGPLGATPALASIVKYDSAAVKLASAALSGAQSGDGFAMDSAHNLYISEKDATGSVTWITKLDPNLVFLSSRTMNNDAIGNITRMASDGAFLYTCNDGGNDNTPKIVKYDASLVPVATYTYTNANVPYSRNCDALAVGASGGDVYAVMASTDMDPNVVLSRRLLAFNNSLSLLGDADLGDTLAPGQPGLVGTPLQLYLTATSTDAAKLFVRKFSLVGVYSGVSSTFTAAPGSFPFADMSSGPNGDIYATSPGFGTLRLDPSSLAAVSSAAFGGVALAVKDSSNVFVSGAVQPGISFDGATNMLNMNQAAGPVRTWIAATPGLASTSGNWSPTGSPVNGESLLFNGSGAGDCQWDLTGVVIASVTLGPNYHGVLGLEPSATQNITGAFTIHSGTVEFRDTFGPFVLQGPVIVNSGKFHVGQTTVSVTLGSANQSSMTFNGGRLDLHDDAVVRANSIYMASASTFTMYDIDPVKSGPMLGKYSGAGLDLVLKGTIDITSGTITELTTKGMRIGATANIIALSSVNFAAPLAFGTTVFNFFEPNTVVVATFTNIGFSDAGISLNVGAGTNLDYPSRITMRGDYGPKAGPKFEQDYVDMVDWAAYPAVFISTPGYYSNGFSNIEGSAQSFLAPISSVSVAVKRLTDGFFWNGATFSAPFAFNLAGYAGGPNAVTWSYPSPSLTNGTSYYIIVKASDTAGRESGDVSKWFTYDIGGPAAAILAPANNSSGASFPTVSGTAFDSESGLAQVLVRISSGPSFGTSWDGVSLWNPGIGFVGALGDSAWSFPGVPSGGNLTLGTIYQIEVKAVDYAGNVNAPVINNFLYQSGAPNPGTFTGNYSQIGGAVFDGGQFDRASALAVHSVSSDVYVVGYSSQGANSNDWAMIRYDQGGVKLSSTAFNFGPGSDDRPNAVVLCGADIYVGGATGRMSPNFRRRINKYDGAWNITASTDTGSAGGGEYTALVCDPLGGVYAASVRTGDNALLVDRFDSSLAGLAAASFGAGAYSNGAGMLRNLARDGSGNVYASGIRTDTMDLRVEKFNASLVPQTSIEFSGADYTVGAALMHFSSQLYATAVSSSAGPMSHTALFRLDTSLVMTASTTLTAGGNVSNSDERTLSFDTDPGSVYVAGSGAFPGLQRCAQDFNPCGQAGGLSDPTNSLVVLSSQTAYATVVNTGNDLVTKRFDPSATQQGGPMVSASAVDLAPTALGQSANDQPMLLLKLWTDTGTKSFSSLRVNLLGDAPAGAIMAKVWKDTDTNGSPDIQLGSMAFVEGQPPYAQLVALGETLSPTTSQYVITVSYSNMPGGKRLRLGLFGPEDLGIGNQDFDFDANPFPIFSEEAVVFVNLAAKPADGGYPNPTAGPSSGGYDTGLFVGSGQQFNVSATGSWFDGSSTFTANGGVPTGGLNELKLGSLVGRLGGGSWFQLGATSTQTASQSGNLFLAMNDTLYSDNSGSVLVSFSILPSTTARVWLGGFPGFEKKASVASNWQGGLKPFFGEKAVFDTASFDCDWDISNTSLGLLEMTTNYNHILKLVSNTANTSNRLEVSTTTRLNRGTLDLGAGHQFEVRGSLILLSSATLDLGAGGADLRLAGLNLSGGATLKSLGSQTVYVDPVFFDQPWLFTVQDATVTVNNAAGTEFFGFDSVVIGTQAVLNVFDHVRLNTYQSQAPEALALKRATVGSLTFHDWIFDVNTSSNVNASQVPAGSTITFNEAQGFRAGSPFEKDPNGVVFWTPDGGGTGAISGQLDFSMGGPGNYFVLVTTDSKGRGEGVGQKVLVSSGVPYNVFGLTAPNTYYLFGFLSQSGGQLPLDLEARGGFGNGGLYRSDPLFLASGASLTGKNLALSEWFVASGSVTLNTPQIGPVRVQSWLGVPPCSTCTLETQTLATQAGTWSMASPRVVGENATFVAFVDLNNNGWADPFEAQGSSGPVTLLGPRPGIQILVGGGSLPPGGTVYLTPSIAHDGSVRLFGRQPMLRLQAYSDGPSSILGAIQVEYTGSPVPYYGPLISVYEDAPGIGFGAFQDQLDVLKGELAVQDVSSTVAIGFNTPSEITGSTRAYFVTVDYGGSRVPEARVAISSTSNFGMGGGIMAPQPGLYPIDSGPAVVKFEVPGFYQAYGNGDGGVFTGFQVFAGQSLTIQSSGTWRTFSGGPDVTGDGSGATGLNTVLPAAKVGELIGRIAQSPFGNSAWFRVGQSTTVPVPVNGELVLAMNDLNGAYYDNEGALLADFSISGATLGAISGTLTYEGAEAGVMTMTAYRLSATSPEAMGSTGVAVGAPSTYAYSIPGLPAGPYTIQAQHSGNPSHSGQTFKPVDLIVGSTVVIDVKAFLGSNSIQGALTYNGVLGFGDFKLAVTTNTDFEHEPVFFGFASTLAAGAYSIDGLPAPNTYYLVAFRDGNNNDQPDGPEPFGYFGAPGAPISQFSVALSTIFVSNIGGPATGKNLTIFDNGAISGNATVPPNSSGALVLEAGRGVPGAPGYKPINREFRPLFGGPSETLGYAVGLLQPATDYTVTAWVDVNGNQNPDSGEPLFQSQAGLAVPTGGNLTLNFSIGAPAAAPAPGGFRGTAVSNNAVEFSWNLVAGAGEYRLVTSTGGLVAALAHPASTYLEALTDNTSSQVRAIFSSNTVGVSLTSSTLGPTFSLAGAPVSLATTSVWVPEGSTWLNWGSNNPGDTAFELFRATAAAAPFVKVLDTNLPSVFNTGLSPQTAYFWKVRAINGNGIASAFGNVVSTVTPASAVPSIAGAVSYLGNQSGAIVVQASTSSSFGFGVTYTVTLPNVSTQSYYTGALPAGLYFVRAFVNTNDDAFRQPFEDLGSITSVNVAGSPVTGQDFSIAVDTVPPAAPAGLQAAPGFRQVRLGWNMPVQSANGTALLDLVGFVVQRTTSANGSGFTDLALLPAVTTYTDLTAVTGTQNFYRVRAADLGGNLSAPTGAIGALPGSGGSVIGALLNFAGATPAGAFRIRLATNPAVNAPFLAESSLSSFSFTGLGDGTYFLRGFKDLDNNGAASQLSEPAGTHGGLNSPYPILIANGNTASNADVILCERTRLFVSSQLAGSLGPNDCPARDKGQGHVTDLYAFSVGDGSQGSVGPGSQVHIAMTSSYDNEVILLGPGGQPVARDNRPGGESAVFTTLNTPGVYLVEPTSFNPGAPGAYSIRMNVSGGFAGSLSGNLTYNGVHTSGVFHVQAFNSPDAGAFPVRRSTIPAGGFSFGGLTDGSYFLRAFRDLNGNFVKDPGEPSGAFGVSESSPTAIVIQGGVASPAGPAAILLNDPAVGAVAGSVLYSGSQVGPIRIEVGVKTCNDCEDLDVVSAASTGTGNTYFLDFVPPATNYFVQAYVDTNLNRRADVLEAKVGQSAVSVVANATTTVSLTMEDPGSGPSGNASIQGIVSYNGSLGGQIFIAFSRDSRFNFMDYILAISTQGPFIKSGILGGTSYYMLAFRDVNGNGNPDDHNGEPLGVGAPEGFEGEPSFSNVPPILLPLSGSVTANLLLQDAPSGEIRGRVEYAGAASLSQNLVVQAYRRSNDGGGGDKGGYQQMTIARQAGVTGYDFTLSFLQAATDFNVSAGIDANGNGHSDQGEAFGQFGASQCSGSGPCYGAAIAVSSGAGAFPVYGVNFDVRDPGGFTEGGGAQGTGEVKSEAFYLGVQGGPAYFRLFSGNSASGVPLFTVRVPSVGQPPAGPAEFNLQKSGLPFGIYTLDVFRDPGDSGVYNPAVHPYAGPATFSLSENNTFQNASLSALVDLGGGGSVNAYTGSFNEPSGARFDGGNSDLALGVTLDTVTANGPYPYVWGITTQNDGARISLVRYSSSAAVMLSSRTIGAEGDGNVPRGVFAAGLGKLFLGSSTRPQNFISDAALSRYSKDLALEKTVTLSSSQAVGEIAYHDGFLYLQMGDGEGGHHLRKVDPATFVTVATGTFVFNGNGPIDNRGLGLTIDPVNGRVFAGLSSSHEDFGAIKLLLRYDLALNLQAQKDITGLSLGRDAVLATDPSGNVILASLTQDSVRTYKFDSNLNQLADSGPLTVKQSLGGGLGNLKTDANGDVYEAWQSTANGGDILVVRYNPGLQLIGSRTYDGLNNTRSDSALSLAVIDSSNVYVTGVSDNGRNLDWVTLRQNLNASGSVSAAPVVVTITTASATRAIYGSVSYQGPLTFGTVRALLFPDGAAQPLRVSTAAFAANSDYLFNSLSDGLYRIRGFLDLNDNLVDDAGEPVFYSPDAGVQFQGSTLAGLDWTLCDRQAIVQGVPVLASLTAADCPAVDRGGAFQKMYTFQGTRGQPVTVAMTGLGFYDTYLTLYDNQGRLTAFDDEGAGDGNARLENFVLPKDGLYTIGASAFSAGITGEFELEFSGSQGSLGSIAGQVDYTGSQGGQIVVGLFNDVSFSSTSFVDSRVLASTRVFSFESLATGTTYYLGAFVDVNFNTNPDPGEDGGVFGTEGSPSAIFLQAGQNLNGVAVLIDPSMAAAAGQAFITGAVGYAGTRFGVVRLEFWSNADFQGRPVSVRDLPSGPGSYDLSVPGGLSYYIRAFMDVNNDFMPNPDEPKGFYSPNNQGAEALFVPVGDTLHGVDLTLRDPGVTAGGAITGEGTASIEPAALFAGAQVFSATITYTAGPSGIQDGGKVGFIVPQGFPFPQSVSRASTATVSLPSFSGPSVFVTVGAGGLPAGTTVTFVYEGQFAPCALGVSTFTVASARSASSFPAPLFSGSPSLAVTVGAPQFFQPQNPYFSLKAGELSERQVLEARDYCGNKSAVVASATATLTGMRFDYNTGAFVNDADVAFSSGAAEAAANALQLGFAVGQSSRSFFAVSASSGFKNIELAFDLGQSNTFYYGLTVLSANALTNASVSTAPATIGKSSATITPNNDNNADQAYVNFNLADPQNGWHILISSTPYKAGAAPQPLWERWGFGQPALGEIAWDGRSSPWINNGLRVPNGLYYVRIELGGAGVKDDSLLVRVLVPQVQGRFFDAGVSPNPPLAGARLQVFGPNGSLFTQTDLSGAYALPGLGAGLNKLVVSRDDFLEGGFNLTLTAGGVVSTFTALSNSVSGALNASGGLDVLMNRSPSLLVTPSLGVGISTEAFDQWGSVQVRAATDSVVQQSIYGPLRLRAGTTTFDDGGQWDPASQQFVVRTVFKFNVAVGTYTVEAFFGGFSRSTASVFVPVSGASLALPAFTRKATVSGLVTVPANAQGMFVSVNAVPLSTAASAAGGFGGVFLDPGVTLGTYTVLGLDAGSYILRANAPNLSALSTGPIVLGAGNLTGVDFPVFGTGAQISGAATVNADTTGKNLVLEVNAWSPGSLNFGSTRVFANGGVLVSIPYLINGLDAGATYQLYVHLQGLDSDLETAEPQPVKKAAPGVQNFTFVASSGTLIGSIKLPDGNTDFLNVFLFGKIVDSPRPETIGKEFVEVSTSLGIFRCQPDNVAHTAGYCPAANSSATFLLQGLRTETLDITMFYKTTGETKKIRLSLVDGSTSTMNVDLSGETFAISGSINNQITNTLFNTNPKIAANAPFIAPAGYPTDVSSTTARVLAIKQDINQFKTAISDVFDPSTSRIGFLTSAGTFTVANVPPGVYFVRTTNLRACATCAVVVPAIGKIISVGANVSSVTFTLSDGYNVSGSVSLDGGLQDSRIFDLVVRNRRQEIVRSTSVYLGDAGLGITANAVPYSFGNLPADDFYTLTVRDASLPAKYAGKPIKFPDASLSPNGLQANLANQNVSLQRAAFLVGRLKDANTGELIGSANAGLLAPNFRISATANPWVEGGFVLAAASVSARPIEADGYFRVGPLIPNVAYDLRLAQTSWDPAFLARGSQNYTPVQLGGLTPTPGEFKDVGVVALNQGSSLTGTLREGTTSGALLGNIKVTARPSYGDSNVVVQTYTNPQGVYTVWVSTFLSNQFDVTAAPRDGNTAANGSVYGEVTRRNVSLLATTTADFLLSPLLAAVTGQVVVEDASTGGQLSFPFGENKGFPAAAINLQPAGVVPIRNPLGDIEAVTEAGGRFNIVGLTTGTYALKATSLGYGVFNATVTASTSTFRIYIGSDTPSNVLAGSVLTLKRGATVTGRILKSDGSAPNDSDVGGVAAANFAAGEFVVGSVEIDQVAKTVNSYTISGFKAGVAYDLVILPRDKSEDISFPPEGSGVTFAASESTATKSINLTFAPSGLDCQATSKALGNNQFQVKLDCTKGLRNTEPSDNDLDTLLTVSTFTQANAAFVAPNGTGQLLGSDKAMSTNRRKITAIYRAAAGESAFSLRLRVQSSTVDPKTGANFALDRVFDFFTGVEANVIGRVANINGGSVVMEPSAEDELLGIDERSQLDMGAGTFAQEGGADVAATTISVSVGMRKGKDELTLGALYRSKFGYAPASVAALSRPSAFPAEMSAAMQAYRSLASTKTVGGANPLSSFYDIFLPAGIRHQLKKNADLTLSYDLTNSTATAADAINVWFYNAALGKFVLEERNRRVDTVNKTITVSVDHFSIFVVLDNPPVANAPNARVFNEIDAVNFPNPADCVVHSNIPRNNVLFGGGVHDPFRGTMIRFSLPGNGFQDGRINVYNLAGELVRTMNTGPVQGGFTHYVPWDCGNNSGHTVGSGVYLGEVVWGGKRKFFKIAIIKGSGL